MNNKIEKRIQDESLKNMKSDEFISLLEKLLIKEIFHLSNEQYHIGNVLENVEFQCLHLKNKSYSYIYTIVPNNDTEIEVTGMCRGKMTKGVITKIELPGLNYLNNAPISYTGTYINEYMKYYSLKLYQSTKRGNVFHVYTTGERETLANINDYRVSRFSEDSKILYLGKGKFVLSTIGNGKADLVNDPIVLSIRGKVTGKRFNEICQKFGVKLFKTLSSSMVHHRLQFKLDEIIDDNIDGDGKGIFFCDQEYVRKWSHYQNEYRPVLVDVIIPDEAQVTIGSTWYSSDKIILTNLRENPDENIQFHRYYRG